MNFRSVFLGAIAISAVSSVRAEWDPQAIVSASGYQVPPASVMSSVLAPWHQNVTSGTLNQGRTHMLVTESDGLVSIETLAKSHVILGGLAIDTVAVRNRNLTIRNSAGLKVMDLKTGQLVVIQIPEGVRVSGASWSPTGTQIGFIGTTEKETKFYIADAKTGACRQVGPNFRLVGVTGFDWVNGGKAISVVLPTGAVQIKSRVMPLVRTSDDRPDALRTYASLLTSEDDADLLEACLTGQPAIVDIGSGAVTKIGSAGMVRSFDVAPDGSGAMVSFYERPFSYMNPVSQFPNRTNLIRRDGSKVMELDFRPGPGNTVARRANKPTDPRGHTWDPLGRGLLFLQTEEQDKEKKDKKPMDQLMLWRAPYEDGKQEVLFKQADRIGGYQFSEDGKWLFTTRSIDGKVKQVALELSAPDKVWVISEPGKDAFYDDPGRLETKPGPVTGRVVMTAGNGEFVFLAGTQYSKDYLKVAPRPFVDRVEIKTGKKERVFESSATKFETVDALNDDYSTKLVRRESSSDVPQFYMEAGGQSVQLTKNVDYNPLLTQARTEVLQVTRADGVKFQVKVTLPPYTTSLSKRPAFFWFYPSEFADQKAYNESLRSENINRFRAPSASNPNHFLNLGYVVIDNDCPIIGPDNAPNDLYTHQLRMNLSATIDAIAKEGWIDRDRLAIGGHSYGAFSTVNALIQTPFFKAGIAGDGNYNRSLTPFGFQAEPRTLWQAREMYQDVSALWNAEKLNGALLMYHGMQDQNMGTDPQHSRNLFQVLESLGKVSSLYMYPYEDHGQIAKETRLDMWARWSAWLEIYVQNPEKYKKKPEEKKDESGNGGASLVIQL